MKKIYLAPDVLLKILLEEDGKFLKSLIIVNDAKIVTSAFCWWEVISCLTAKEMKEKSRHIVKCLKLIPIVDLEQLTGKSEVQNEERIEHLRNIATKPFSRTMGGK